MEKAATQPKLFGIGLLNSMMLGLPFLVFIYLFLNYESGNKLQWIYGGLALVVYIFVPVMKPFKEERNKGLSRKWFLLGSVLGTTMIVALLWALA
ncbi:hypothetical protein [Planomicrobium sp. YIM 101495]|uniref:hypothetical protein n=1 Tax=Planomicrobium sp. YIM 101495 TaxID=2665160 RepID=UPI0012B82638|nr:hypothetical protein [Planomicrobium sp. YIM 101495]MTD29571.1 hypothetical protein [Planomicrobium sp. YIM 101495]